MGGLDGHGVGMAEELVGREGVARAVFGCECEALICRLFFAIWGYGDCAGENRELAGRKRLGFRSIGAFTRFW